MGQKRCDEVVCGFKRCKTFLWSVWESVNGSSSFRNLGSAEKKQKSVDFANESKYQYFQF